MKSIQLVAIGSLAAFTTIIQIGASTLSASTGMVWAEGILGVILINAMFVLTPFIVPRFGSTTLLGFIFGLLTLSLFAFGPPGFIPKVPANALAGLVTDISYLILPKRLSRAVRSFLIGWFTQLFTGLMFYGAGFLFVESGILTSVPKIFLTPIGLTIGILISAILGGIGGLLTYLIYSKIKNTSTIQRIQQ